MFVKEISSSYNYFKWLVLLSAECFFSSASLLMDLLQLSSSKVQTYAVAKELILLKLRGPAEIKRGH